MGLWTSLLLYFWGHAAGGSNKSGGTSSSAAPTAERPTQRCAAGALLKLAAAGDRVGVERLLARGADPNTAAGGWGGAYSPGTTALMLACEMRSFKCMKVVRMLLSAGADPNAANAGGDTALMVVAANAQGIGQEALLTMLLAAGADPNPFNANGTTAVALASKSGLTAVVSKLLAAGADPNAAADRSWPPLLVAARAGHLDVVSVLLNAGAEINKANADGVTALTVASGFKHAAVVSALLAAGADPKDSGPDGLTAVMAAASGRQERVVSILMAAGAERVAWSRARHWAWQFKRVQGMLLKALTYLTSRVQRSVQDPDSEAMKAAAADADADAVAAKLSTDEEADRLPCDKAKGSGGNKKNKKQQTKKVKLNKPTPQEGASATVLASGLLAVTAEPQLSAVAEVTAEPQLPEVAEEQAAGSSAEMPEELIDLSQAQGLPTDHDDAGLSAVAGGAMYMPPSKHPVPLAPGPRPTRSCSCCGLTSSSMHKCAGCLVARYCSPQCQKKDWREGGHKAACAGLKAQRGG